SEYSNPNQLASNTIKTVDLESYQLPDDVMNFFEPLDDSNEIIRKSSLSSKDFMKVHRRYSSTSAAAQEESLYSLDLSYQDKSKSSSTSSSSMTTPYATRYYGQHMRTWHQMRQVENNRITEFDASIDANFGIVDDEVSYKTTPTILEHHQSTISSGLLEMKSESSQNLMPNTTNGFFTNLKAAVRSHAYSPTKRHNLPNINNSDTEEPLLKSNAHLLPPVLPHPIRHPALSYNGNETNSEGLKTSGSSYGIETNLSVTEESSIQVNSQPLKMKLPISESLNSDNNQPPPRTSDDSSHKHDNSSNKFKLVKKRSFMLGNSNGEKKEWRLSSAPGLFSGWGTKISGNKGTGGGDGLLNNVKKD
ncbi:10296_t:CDS:2, partial [Ambispora leptoticha]